ncbi:MAG: hypothetical protein ABI396_16790 [Ktedonobacteraceae bacterium]
MLFPSSITIPLREVGVTPLPRVASRTAPQADQPEKTNFTLSFTRPN